MAGYRFAHRNHELIGQVFETDAFEGDGPLEVTLVEEGKNGALNLYQVRERAMSLTLDEDTFGSLVGKGYIPIVTHSLGVMPPVGDASTALSVAALLAMQAVRIVLPRTKAAAPGEILAARHRLRDHLPPFWSAMLKLSIELRARIRDVNSETKMAAEVRDLVDTTVRPALIDLQTKLERERRQWAYRILAPLQKGLRLIIGNPPISQQQLITTALVLGSDVAMSAAEHMRTVEALKQEAGLTFLLETQKALAESDAG